MNEKKINKLYIIFKRIFDIIVSIIGCVLLIPIIIIIKLLYIINKDLAPIILTQKRIGKNGKVFKFYKIRTMVVNADEILFKLMEENIEIRKEYQKNKKLKNDPRITKTGKIIRKYSIDELPQFFNILKGDMSFVGNRPYLLREKKDMGSYYKDIIKTKPGLTGLWQTSGRNDISFKKRLKLEKYYSNNYTLKMDIIIFFKTFKVVLFSDGTK